MLQYSQNSLFTLLVVLSRIMVIILFMPTLGVGSIPGRIKAAFAFILSILITTSLPEELSIKYATRSFLLETMCYEVSIGLVIGIIANIITNTSTIAASIISAQSGLSSATLFDPASKSQTTSIGLLVNTMLIGVIFFTDLYLFYIKGLAGSYEKFPLNGIGHISINDALQNALNAFRQSWLVGLEIAFPSIIASLVMTVGIGVLSRLMSKLQILFIALPAQICMSILIMICIISVISIKFFNYWSESLSSLMN